MVRRAPFRLLLTCVIVALIAAATLAQGSRVDLEGLDAYFRKALADWEVPGMAIAIVKDDRVVLARGYGVREIGRPDRIDEHTLFGIASNTKAFTTAAIARLVDEKRLAWDDRVVDHLPYFRLYDEYVTNDMRIRDLLSHRSGVRTFGGDLVWYGTNYSREEVVRRARFLTQEGPFRSHYGYSNIMFIAAGEIVARVAGRTWDDYVRREFFDPLGMRRTVTSVGALAGNDNVATPHAAFEGDLRTFRWISWDNAGPAGSIVSSVADMAAWIRLQLGRGALEGRTYFSDSASRVMWTPHVSFTVDQAAESRIPSTQFRGYGLGWSLSDYRGRLVASHGGAVDGMFSNVTLVPQERLGIVVLTNSDSGASGALPYRVIDEYVGGQERDWSGEARERARAGVNARDAERESVARARVQGTKPSLPLEAYAGTYPSDLYGDARVTIERGRLVLHLVPNPELIADLTHWHFDTFALTWRRPWPWFGGGRVQFVLDQNARINELKLDVPNDDFWFWEPRFLRAPDGR
jgi:CubicO group peptidase (beta-lactamase class C family)